MKAAAKGKGRGAPAGGRPAKEGGKEERHIPPPGMLEKYYHIKGAIAFREGRLDRAIRFFRKALALDDQAYTHLYLSMVHEAKNDLARALKEITKAIELAPTNAEYYLRRSVIRQHGGNGTQAEEDRLAAVRLDPNCSRITEIRKALKAIRNAFTRGDQDDRLEAVTVNDARLSRIVAGVLDSRRGKRQAVEHQSCPVDCPAYCCYFSRELFLHGVCVGPWKLQAIRGYLRQQGIPEDTVLEKRTIGKEEFRLRLLPPDVVITEGGQGKVFYPKRTDKRIGPKEAPAIPPGLDYSRIDWITEESRACAFLSERRCKIHDLAGEPALPACKEFLCLTGFIFLILSHLRIVSQKEMRNVPIAAANNVAVEACLLLARRIYANEKVAFLEAEIDRTINRAMEADRGETGQEVAELVDRYRALRRRLDLYLSRQRKLLQEEIGRLLKAPHG
jgi:hypothetical protein